MLTRLEPHTGNILIAEPFMMDINFRRSVVLLAEHSEEEVVGYVINQKSNLLLRDVLPDCWDANFPVYLGGPVATDTLNFVHACPDKIAGGFDIGNGLYWGGDFEMLKLQVNSYAIKEHEIKFFIGYAGWSAKQLKGEIRENTWLVSDRFSADVLFDESDSDIWKEAIINLGEKFAHIVHFPENPQLN